MPDLPRRTLSSVTIIGMFAAISVAALLTRQANGLVHEPVYYLYLAPIALAAYWFGLDIALLVSLAATSLFVPLLIRSVIDTPWFEGNATLFMILVTFNLAAGLIARWFDFQHHHAKVHQAVEGMEHVAKGALDVEGLLAVVLNQCMQLCDAQGGQIFFRQADAGRLMVKSGASLGLASGEAPSDDATVQSLTDWLVECDERTVVHDLDRDARFMLPQGLTPRTSLLAIPLRPGGQTQGLLALWRFGNQRFGRAENDVLTMFLNASQVVIENAALYARLEEIFAEQNRHVSLLIEASTLFSTARTLAELVDAFCREMLEAADATYCKLGLIEPGGNRITFRGYQAVRDWDSQTYLNETFSLEALPWHQRAIRKGEPLLLIRGIPQSGTAEPERSLIGTVGGSALLVPLIVNERCIGVATIGEMRSWRRSSFSNEKTRLCFTVARLGALAIENLRAIESNLQQGERLGLIVDNVADGIFLTDREGRIESFNPAAERITGYTRENVIGRRCADLLRGSSAEGTPLCPTACPLENSLARTGVGEPAQIKEWITRGDGNKVLVAHSSAPLGDGDGQIPGVVSVIRDITREEELVRLKTEFISMVSHELRTPLSTINTSLEMLNRKDLEPSSRQEMLEILNRQSAHLVHLVDQVLESSRLETGRVRLTLEPLAIMPLILRVISQYRARHKDYSFRIAPVPGTPYAMGALISVEVILENLIQNAINYSSPGGAITVSAEEGPDSVRISVADEGPGIPAKDLKAVFEPFHRLSAEAGSHAAGFGLGLHIARMLVEAQGGRIWAESEPNQGSRFCFTLNKLGQPDGQDSDC